MLFKNEWQARNCSRPDLEPDSILRGRVVARGLEGETHRASRDFMTGIVAPLDPRQRAPLATRRHTEPLWQRKAFDPSVAFGKKNLCKREARVIIWSTRDGSWRERQHWVRAEGAAVLQNAQQETWGLTWSMRQVFPIKPNQTIKTPKQYLNTVKECVILFTTEGQKGKMALFWRHN